MDMGSVLSGRITAGKMLAETILDSIAQGGISLLFSYTVTEARRNCNRISRFARIFSRGS